MQNCLREERFLGWEVSFIKATECCCHAVYQLSNHVPGVPYRRVRVFEHSLVVPVEVAPSQRAPVVAHYHTIRVQHRHNLEDECVSQQLAKEKIGKKQQHYLTKKRDKSKQYCSLLMKNFSHLLFYIPDHFLSLYLSHTQLVPIWHFHAIPTETTALTI